MCIHAVCKVGDILVRSLQKIRSYKQKLEEFLPETDINIIQITEITELSNEYIFKGIIKINYILEKHIIVFGETRSQFGNFTFKIIFFKIKMNFQPIKLFQLIKKKIFILFIFISQQ